MGNDEINNDGISIDQAITVTTKTEVEPGTLCVERKRYYSINNKMFVDKFMSQLKVVYYLAEDEKDKNNFLDSAMYGHVYQKYLPGMFVTLDGKYYEIISMTKNNGVLVRRAADHITSRHYYRILREYSLKCYTLNNTVGVKYSYGDIIIERAEADITVNTLGYLEMSEYSDIKNARRVELSNIEPREYRNKECIKIHLANSTHDVRVTVATLLNELFVTIFPDTYQYIVASTKCEQDEQTQGLIPKLIKADDDCIYIIEDSLIDLGLLINVERYFRRFLEIICDVLDWHKEKLVEKTQIEDGGDDDTENNANSVSLLETVINGDSQKTPYAESFFLLYGYDSVPKAIDLDATLKYLSEPGLADNYLKQARKKNGHSPD